MGRVNVEKKKHTSTKGGDGGGNEAVLVFWCVWMSTEGCSGKTQDLEISPTELQKWEINCFNKNALHVLISLTFDKYDF